MSRTIDDNPLKRYVQLSDKVDSLFDVIKHGDQDHQDWLEKKIKDHFSEEEPE